MATFLPANLLLRASLASGRAVRAVSTTAVRLAGGEDSSSSGLRVHGNVLGGEAITAGAKQTFEAWHHALNKAKADPSTPQSELEDGLLERVHEKVHFHPPTYFKHWEGRDEFVLLIKTVSEVFGPTFEYHRQWLSPDGKEWCLEFKAPIDGDAKAAIHGVDLVTLDDDGKIVDFRVLARPPNAVNKLKDVMMKRAAPRLAMLKAKQSVSSLWK